LLRYSNFSIFQYGGRRHFGFLKIGNFSGWWAVGDKYAPSLKNFLKIGQMVVEISRFNGFQNSGRPTSGIRRAHIWTTHDEYLVVSIIVQNLVRIDAVVLVALTSV